MIEHVAVADDAAAGQRLDVTAARLFPQFSRARLQAWIRDGALTADGRSLRPRDRLWGGEALRLHVKLEPVAEHRAQNIALDILDEDEHLLVVNKPAGLVVHPAAGHRDGTLVNALLHYCPALEMLPRAGIVHRLDKDTTGLMVVAKTLASHHSLVAALQARAVYREYEAVVTGVMTGGGTLSTAYGRHERDRKRMAVVSQGGKQAITHYRVLQRFSAHTHVQCQLETGRTHQIRVHMAHLRHPLIGDATYGGRLRLPPEASIELQTLLRDFNRQALHARRLALTHPIHGGEVAWEAPLPEDMTALLAALKAETPH